LTPRQVLPIPAASPFECCLTLSRHSPNVVAVTPEARRGFRAKRPRPQAPHCGCNYDCLNLSTLDHLLSQCRGRLIQGWDLRQNQLWIEASRLRFINLSGMRPVCTHPGYPSPSHHLAVVSVMATRGCGRKPRGSAHFLTSAPRCGCYLPSLIAQTAIS
jgi:hypothetical protein